MSNPTAKTCAADAWTKVATNITAGKFHIKRMTADDTGAHLKYQWTYVDTSTAAPSGLSLAVPMFDETRHESFTAAAAADVYVYVTGGAGLIRADV